MLSADPEPPMGNAHAERFNRTLQESFVDDHDDLRFADLVRSRRKRAGGLVFHNARRPHPRLEKTPGSFLLEQLTEECSSGRTQMDLEIE